MLKAAVQIGAQGRRQQCWPHWDGVSKTPSFLVVKVVVSTPLATILSCLAPLLTWDIELVDIHGKNEREENLFFLLGVWAETPGDDAERAPSLQLLHVEPSGRPASKRHST